MSRTSPSRKCPLGSLIRHGPLCPPRSRILRCPRCRTCRSWPPTHRTQRNIRCQHRSLYQLRCQCLRLCPTRSRSRSQPLSPCQPRSRSQPRTLHRHHIHFQPPSRCRRCRHCLPRTPCQHRGLSQRRCRTPRPTLCRRLTPNLRRTRPLSLFQRPSHRCPSCRHLANLLPGGGRYDS